MSPRTLGIGALVVVGAVIALLLALGGDDPPGQTAARTPDPEAPPPAPRRPPAVAPPPTPAVDRADLPPLPGSRAPVPAKPTPLGTTGAGELPLWTAFDDEPRDPSWAPDQELAIRNRLRPLLDSANHDRPGAVRVPQVACKEQLCRMLITGSNQREFQRFVESLQDERGFYGDAALLALDSYGETTSKESGDQVYQVRVHLKYERR